MLRKQKITTGLMLLALTAAAQQQNSTATDSLLLRDYQYVVRQDPWMETDNAAALTRFSSRNIAHAQLAFTLKGASLRNYSEARHVTELEVGAEALHRLSQRTVVYGAIAYDNFSGSHMTGSMFIDPERKPFDITEYSADNAGDKHRDTYRLTGAVGADLWRGWAVGARLDYTSANYAKYKDLRHKNKLMDLSASAGLYIPLCSWMSLGAHYTYHRNTESLNFSVNGKNEVVYKSLINYGAYFGSIEQFGNDGYTDQAREMPLFEDGHGFGLQGEVLPMQGLSLQGTYSYASASGYYGRKSPYTITYTGHERRTHQATAAVVYQGHDSRQRLDISYAVEKLAAHAETVRGQKNETGATYYEYYDPVETADKQWRDASVNYCADLHVRGEVPLWQLSAGYAWHERKQAAYLYPFYRHQQLHVNQVSAGAVRNLPASKGIYTVALGVGYQKGHGYPSSDHTFVDPSDRQEPPTAMGEALLQEYDFLTASQWCFQGRLQYAFIFPGTHMKTRAGLSIEHRTASFASATTGSIALNFEL